MMKLFDRFMETCDRLDDEDRFWGRIVFYVTSFVWMYYLKAFIHELGHAVTAIALGGTVTDLWIKLEGGGGIYYFPPIDTMPYDCIVMNTLVLVSGGIAAMLFFVILSHKTKWFLIPAILSLLNGFLEALYMNDIRASLSSFIILASWWAICTLIHGVVRHSLKPIESERNWKDE